MASIVSTHEIKCPVCGKMGILRIWSCGCQEVSDFGHEILCTGYTEYNRNAKNPFDAYKINCGESGPKKNHNAIEDSHNRQLITHIVRYE
jgi:hypothetical protein